MLTRSIITLLLLSTAFVSCSDDENEDITESVNKDGSIESSVHVAHLDSLHDVLTTTHKIWIKNNVFKTTEYKDTIPALGTEHTVAENSDGDSRNVAVKKDYEIYITVK